MVGALSVAVASQRWELASLYLLLGTLEAAHKLPSEAVAEMLELLGGDTDATPSRDGRSRRSN